VGVCLVALVTHTWLVMGLVVPVTVAGSSMAPTLSGPRSSYHCDVCQKEFAVGFDQLANNSPPVCPQCGSWASDRSTAVLRGDRLFVDRTAFVLRPPRRWEVVVFRSPVDVCQLCVKRIVGLPGETVALAAGDVLVDGRQIRPPRDFRYELRYGDEDGLRDGWQLGPSEYLVLGDNTEISADSRSWPTGPALDAKLLLGKPLGVR
jgi:signal peptidase I